MNPGRLDHWIPQITSIQCRSQDRVCRQCRTGHHRFIGGLGGCTEPRRDCTGSLSLRIIQGCTYTFTVRSERKRGHWFVKLVDRELGGYCVVVENLRLTNIEEMEYAGGGIIQRSWKCGVADSRLWEIYVTLTFAKGTLGLEQGRSNDESFNVSHKCRGIRQKPGGPGGNFCRRCPVLSAGQTHGGVTATVPQFSDLVYSQKGHHQPRADGPDQERGCRDLLLHAPPVHEARVDQKGVFARTITFTDGKWIIGREKRRCIEFIQGTEEHAICNLWVGDIQYLAC